MSHLASQVAAAMENGGRRAKTMLSRVEARRVELVPVMESDKITGGWLTGKPGPHPVGLPCTLLIFWPLELIFRAISLK